MTPAMVAPPWESFEYQREAMEAAGQDLMDLQLESGRPVVQDGRRMSVISLAFTLKSVVMLAELIFDSELCRWVQIVPLGCAGVGMLYRHG